MTLVAIVMGSDSDLERMQPCAEVLSKLAIPFEVRVLSAHRTPEALDAFVADATKRGVKLFVGAAGGAAHLAGTLAAKTDLPVIGVPIDNPPLGGLDALLATVQMPPGIPVATVAVGSSGPRNAAWLAARILALGDAGIATRLRAERGALAKKVLDA
ncbi:MAG TPA: 5-(carboxyamino)imidazole ribonucleotide mutase, partial [Planctomycetota bacterium]|nr:5-(carboxyamino)imidazole ribonucleotide mutase [Planctomycetota bacterium]